MGVCVWVGGGGGVQPSDAVFDWLMSVLAKAELNTSFQRQTGL